MSNIFFNPSGRIFNLDEMVLELTSFIKENEHRRYELIIGTDSNANRVAHFVTAVTFRRIGNGARYFWTRSQPIECHNLTDRIYRETIFSITLSQEVRGRLKEKLGEDIFWDDKIKVHIDVGKNGPTKDLIDGVVGMVKGYGLEAVIKPDAFGAFVVADRHT